MSEELTFAGFAAMFRLGPEKITMTKADAVRLAEVAQVASDEITRLRAENARLREAIEMARECIAKARKDAPSPTGKHVEHPGNGARLTTLGQPVGKGEGDD